MAQIVALPRTKEDRFMANVVALPKKHIDVPSRFVTFVVPAPSDCNLDCPGCVSYERHEDVPVLWSESDYRQVARDCVISGGAQYVTIQAIEPLLPVAMPYTSALMHEVHALRMAGYDVGSSIITNGSYISEYVGTLAWMVGTLGTDVHFTIVGAEASVHDRWRRQRHKKDRSAFADLMQGLTGAHKTLVPGTTSLLTDHMTAVIVLLPRKQGLADSVAGIPRLLKSKGIKRAVAQPFIVINDAEPGKLVDRAECQATLEVLMSECNKYDILFEVDDLDQALQNHDVDLSDFLVQTNTKPFGRWLPNGRLTTASDFMRAQSDELPQWLPNRQGPTPGELFAQHIVE